MQVFVAYLAITGGVSAGLQVTRGFVRAGGKLLEGAPCAAVTEAIGGLVAPVQQVCSESMKLAMDAWVASQALSRDSDSWIATPNGRACRGRSPGDFAADGVTQ